jgi:parallel beta-helix repeat protein
MQLIRSYTFACLTLILLAGLSGQAFSATVAVGTCTGLVHFATIQLAVVSSPANSTIEICPGTYAEQVSITKRLTLKGIASPLDPTQNEVVIVPPTTGMVQSTLDVDNLSLPIAAQIFVQGVTGVSISNLTVDGTGNGITGCAPDLQGILFQNASGTVNHVALRNQALMPSASLGGCQSGEAIYVQTAAGMTSSVTVQNSSVHGYQKNGITGNDAGTSLTVTGNYVQGSGVVPVPGAAQNGIQIGFGATGKISTNTVIDNIYGDPTIAASADVLLYDAAANGGITVATNTLGNSQLPIGVFTDAPGTAESGDGVSITANKVFGTAVYDAIDVCTNGNTVKTNTVINSAESGVHLDASCGGTGTGNTVSGNTFVESGCAGILDDTGLNTTSPNTYFTVPNTLTNTCSPGTARVRTPLKYSPAR